ncbi:AMP-binding protein [Falsarthrobacter nasiphocae]|uniref:O-succinylbenzoic acid--CoA ligase n=1 Tax=Falsarthrobacter nasiphocae TaxID=189863 RepID=A0AAE3YFT7_9MICC|nr:AMP-binding protein [Falsarthrobacter nasiphocae]MDR6892380.1 O-succinylbenzoic acid--CoA ligase [Falsarthrobacter nasiphocae]
MDLLPLCLGDGDDPRRLLTPLHDALSGDGPAVAPHIDPSMEFAETLPNDDIAVVVCTSGSTGTPKQTMLTTEALGASSAATAERLGFEGQWLLALPVHFVAGLQVLVRSLYSGLPPAIDPSLTSGGFTPQGFADAASELTDRRRLTSLVPTQLARLLDDPKQTALPALRRFDAILLGGAATPARLRAQAAREGLNVIQTYGSAETAGGCVYDGTPLPGVELDFHEGRIILGGPTIASGYLGDPELTDRAFRSDGTTRWFRTADNGSVDDDGRLRVTGRIDDVIITGGVKVSALAVREVLEEIPGVHSAFVTSLPDPEWGQAVAAFVASPRPTAEVLAAARERLSGAMRPKLVLTAPHLPLLPNGKEDRVSMIRALHLASGISAETA